MEIKNKDFAYLFCFPLHIEENMKTVSEIKCFQLIWLKCCYQRDFKNVIVSKRDRERVKLPRISYMRGLEELEKKGFIIVDRKNGRACRISVSVELLDQKSRDSVLKGSNPT